MSASKHYSRSFITIFGIIAAVLLMVGVATPAAFADELTAAQLGDSEPAKAWDLPKDADAAKDASAHAALSAQSDDGAVELAGNRVSVQSGDDSFQFVLSWGELPYDLDSHVEGYRPNGESIHVYYANSSEDYSGDAYCTLDYDDTDSYGPETVDLKSSSQYPCYYYVYNYSGSPDIRWSHAVVKVYQNGVLKGTKKVPLLGTGRYWNICAVQNGKITWYDDAVQRSAITEEPNLGYVSFPKWNTTSQGKRKYPNHRHWGTNLDHYLTSTSDVTSLYPNFGVTATNFYPIPGLEYSSAAGGCDATVPQGVCVTKDYIVITEYCAGDLLKKMADTSTKNKYDKMFVKNELLVHSKSGLTHNPALYVLDRDTGAYVATVEIQGIGANHVGGIAFDGSNFWVATSTDKVNGTLQELKIPYQTFSDSLAARDTAKVTKGTGGVQLVQLVGSAKYLDSASYNAYDPKEKLLWVGNNTEPGKIVAFAADGDNFKVEKFFNIPKGANGAAIAYDNGRQYLLLSVSPGRHKSSWLYRWDITKKASDATLSDADSNKLMELPPMLEELCVDGDSLYSVYESGATVYGCFEGPTVSKKSSGGIVSYPALENGRADVSVDVVCEGSVSTILNTRFKSKTNKANKTRISVACPVTVELLNADGEVVGRIYDDWVDEDFDDEDVVAWVDGDVKSFLVPSDSQYSLNIMATDDGQMDVTAVQYDDEGEAASMVTYSDVGLVEDESHSASLSALQGEDAVSARFTLADPDSQVVDPTQVVDADVEKCQVTTVVEGEGYVSDSMQIAKGDYCTVSATPEEWAVFDGWYVDDEQVSTDLEYEFWVTDDVELLARFSVPDYALSHVSVEGDGSIETDEPGALVDEGVELRAVPDSDGWFDGWYLNGKRISTSADYWFYAEDEDGLVAKFSPAQVANVSVAAGGNGLGEVELLKNDAKVGGQATVSAYAHNRATFEGWHAGSADGELVSTDEEYTFTIEGDTMLVANFVDGPERLATVTVKTIGSGVVKAVLGNAEGAEGDGDGGDASGSASDSEIVTQISVPIEDEITLFAVPDGSAGDGDDGDSSDTVSFTGWVFNGSQFGTDTQKTWTVMEDTEVVAWFSDASVSVSASIVGDYDPDEVSLSPTSVTASSPEPVEFEIDYDSDDYDFLGWYCDGQLISEDSWLEVMPTEGMKIEARVQKAAYTTIKYVYDSNYGGIDCWDDSGYSIDEDDPVRVNSTIHLEAYTYYGVTFDGWYLNGAFVSSDEECEFTVTEGMQIEARFSPYREDISNTTVSGISSYTYTGAAIKPAPTVKYFGYKLVPDFDYVIAYKNNKNAGTATMTITGIGYYTGTIQVPFTINKAAQAMTAKAAKKKTTVLRAKVKKKAVSLKKALTVKSAAGVVSYANASTKKALKKFKVNAKNGTIKVPKGTKKGTYKLKVKVTAAGNKNYTAGSKIVTVKIVVK